jgi:hypothetical protein
MTIRATLPGQRVCFASEILHYAALAALSPELWPPMVEAAPRDTTEQIMNRLVELAAGASSEVHSAGVELGNRSRWPAWLHVVTS